jgi:hypothetical protein
LENGRCQITHLGDKQTAPQGDVVKPLSHYSMSYDHCLQVSPYLHSGRRGLRQTSSISFVFGGSVIRPNKGAHMESWQMNNGGKSNE